MSCVQHRDADKKKNKPQQKKKKKKKKTKKPHKNPKNNNPPTKFSLSTQHLMRRRSHPPLKMFGRHGEGGRLTETPNISGICRKRRLQARKSKTFLL